MAERAAKQASKDQSAAAATCGPQGEAVPQRGKQGFAGWLLGLQQTHGNHYVEGLLRGLPVQRKCACGGTCASCRGDRDDLDRKATAHPSAPSVTTGELNIGTTQELNISRPGDPHEQEADRAADEAVRLFEEADAPSREDRPTAASAARMIHPTAHRKESVGAQTGGGIAGLNFGAALSGGSPLEPRTREPMERFFGHDLSGVRVHRSAAAAESAKAVNALAYTVGSDIVFGAGQYAPETREGRRLLAHELTHVAQQGRGGALHPSLIQRQTPTGSSPTTSDPTSPGGGLSTEMLEQIARRLHDAMDRIGTDEEAIYAAFAGRTQAQVDAIAETYRRLFHRDLLEHLRDELNESEMQHLGIFAPGAAASVGGTPAELVAHQLDEAMGRQVGTDESAVYAALAGRTQTEREDIKTAYRALTHRALEADIRDEFSGAELTEALMLLNQGMLQPEDEIYLAVEGLGTDEDRIFRVLEGMRGNNGAIEALDRNYRDKYGDLIGDLRGDLSGEDLERVRAVLAPVLQDVAFEDCHDPGKIQQVRTAMADAIPRVENAGRVLAQGWDRMNAVETTLFNKYFDPSGSGVDAGFVAQVLVNFRALLRELDRDVVVECEDPSFMCSGETNAYTWWADIHVCPPFFTRSQANQAKILIHEAAHNTLMAVDRAYFWQTSDFDALTPRGTAARFVPILGPLFTLIARTDTLNNPDSYACFANELGGGGACPRSP
jgi:hypothetical protein